MFKRILGSSKDEVLTRANEFRDSDPESDWELFDIREINRYGVSVWELVLGRLNYGETEWR